MTKKPSNPKAELVALEIYNSICEYYSIPSVQVLSKSQKREYVEVRQMAMVQIHRLLQLELSLAEIGSLIGGKDHATVLHAKKTITNLCDTDREMQVKLVDCEIIANRILKKHQHEIQKPIVLSRELTRLLNKDYNGMKSGLVNLLEKHNLEIVL